MGSGGDPSKALKRRPVVAPYSVATLRVNEDQRRLRLPRYHKKDMSIPKKMHPFFPCEDIFVFVERFSFPPGILVERGQTVKN